MTKAFDIVRLKDVRDTVNQNKIHILRPNNSFTDTDRTPHGVKLVDPQGLTLLAMIRDIFKRNIT